MPAVSPISHPSSLVPSVPATEASDSPLAAPATPEALIRRLQREACGDARLSTCAPADAIEQAVSETVIALWSQSRVKTFVSVLAMREVRHRLGADGPGVEVAARASEVIRPGSRPERDRDELLLSENDVLTLSDDFGPGNA